MAITIYPNRGGLGQGIARIKSGAIVLDRPVEAPSFLVGGEYDFVPLYVAGVPQTASLQILKDQPQRVAIPSGATAIRLTFRGFGPFAYRLGNSDVTAAATDAPGQIDPTVVVPAAGMTYVSVYGLGAGSLIVEAGSTLPKTGFVPLYSGGAPKVATLNIASGTGAQRVALPTECTAYRLTFRDYGPFAYRLGDSNAVAVGTDSPGDVLSPVIIPAIPGETHIAVYGTGSGSLIVEGGLKA